METGTMSERGLSGAIVNKIVPGKMDTPIQKKKPR